MPGIAHRPLEVAGGVRDDDAGALPRLAVGHQRVEPADARLLHVAEVDGVVDVPHRVHVAPADRNALDVRRAFAVRSFIVALIIICAPCRANRWSTTSSSSAAGPPGLAAAIRAEAARAEQARTRVCVVEKGSEVGAHILSGAVMDPRALDRALPGLEGARRAAQRAGDRGPLPLPHRERRARRCRTSCCPAASRTTATTSSSLGNVCRWLGQQAEALGVEIFPGFAAAEVLYTEDGTRARRRHRRHGHRQGRREDRRATSPAWSCTRKYTLFAEGCRGHLGRQLEARFKLRDGARPAGLRHRPEGAVGGEAGASTSRASSCTPPAGRSTRDTYGGSFLYHLENNQVAVGFVVGLGYANPYLIPFEEFQRYKTHPAIRGFFEGGKRIAYGARAITAGGLQSLPKLAFPGGALVGDDAGFLNASRIKGSHAAIKSGMLAAEAAFEALAAGRARRRARRLSRGLPRRAGCTTSCTARATSSRGCRKGLYTGTLMVGIDQVAVPRQGAVDAAPQRTPTTRRCSRKTECAADRLSEARRRAHLRPAVVGVRLEHQPRGGPAGAPDAEGPGGPGRRSTCASTTGPRRATARPASTSSSTTTTAARACRSTRRTACTARPATSRTRRRTSSGSRPKAAAGPNYPNM